MDKVKISQQIAFLLRHKKGFTAKNGFVSTEKLIAEVQKQYPDFSTELLEEIVAEDNKQRYSFSKDHKQIRANQGHSTGVQIDFEVKTPPPVLYHGTAKHTLDKICKEGIKSMSRDYVQLSEDYNTAVTVGNRHGIPVVLKVDTVKMLNDGCVFKISENGVWLISYVAPQYIEVFEG
ncbi:MAG: RNA 2'-phosphotransferase [Acutalibacteraceae bacterium]